MAITAKYGGSLSNLPKIEKVVPEFKKVGLFYSEMNYLILSNILKQHANISCAVISEITIASARL